MAGRKAEFDRKHPSFVLVLVVVVVKALILILISLNRSYCSGVIPPSIDSSKYRSA